MTAVADLEADASVWNGVVPLTQVLADITPAYGGETWEDARRYLLSIPSEAAVVASLIRRMDPDQLFDTPVVVDPEELRLSNGMHRVVAAWVTGAPGLRVATEFPDAPHDEYIDVRFTIAPPAGGFPATTGEPLDELPDAVDYMAGWLRSFPVADTWAEQLFSGMFSGVCQASWHCPHRYVDKLIDELERRCRRDRVTLTVLRVTPYTGDHFPD